MNKKTIIIIVATTLLCGLPGLAGLCFGSMALLGIFMPDSGVPSEDRGLAAGFSVMMLGLGLVFITIPIGVGLWSWWSQKKEAAAMEMLILPDEDF
jgi:hypothetical protein